MGGGAPLFMPGMAAQQTPGGYAPQGYAQGGYPPAVPARAGGIPVLPTGIARGARGEEPAKAAAPVRAWSVAIPTPRDLGLGSAPRQEAVAVDWTATRRQLDDVGAVRFQLETLPAGGSRFSCWLRDGSSLRPITGEGASEGEAVRLCMARARQARP